MKSEINGGQIIFVNSTGKNINDYLDFVTSSSKDKHNCTLARYSEIDENQIIEWSKSWSKQIAMILA